MLARFRLRSDRYTEFKVSAPNRMPVIIGVPDWNPILSRIVPGDEIVVVALTAGHPPSSYEVDCFLTHDLDDAQQFFESGCELPILLWTDNEESSVSWPKSVCHVPELSLDHPARLASQVRRALAKFDTSWSREALGYPVVLGVPEWSSMLNSIVPGKEIELVVITGDNLGSVELDCFLTGDQEDTMMFFGGGHEIPILMLTSDEEGLVDSPLSGPKSVYNVNKLSLDHPAQLASEVRRILPRFGV